MAEVVYLHVGAPKTGTTYIQDRLALNRSSLASHDVRYPIGVRDDMFGAALDLIEEPWGGQLDDVRGEWAALVRRTRRARGTAIISHEILAAASPEQIERAVTDLAPAEVHIVLTARDIARQVPAEWQERLKHRRAATYGKFIRGVQDPQSPIGRSFWRVQGVPQVLERWSRQLTPDRVHVVTVPQSGARPGELWLRFCRAVGVDPAWVPRDSVRRNPSIGVAESAMLRRLNRRLREAGVASADYRRIVREIVVHRTLAAEPSDHRLILPPDLHPWAAGVAESWREWIVGAGVDVIGDLDDLCPAPPDEHTVWQDPDKARPREIADAALDALVAVVEEAARRPDPHGQLGAKISRAARRLRDR